jgi:hypothetical protein
MSDMQSNMKDRSEKSKSEPTNQQTQENAPRSAAPKNQVEKSGRLPLFRK